MKVFVPAPAAGKSLAGNHSEYTTLDNNAIFEKNNQTCFFLREISLSKGTR